MSFNVVAKRPKITLWLWSLVGSSTCCVEEDEGETTGVGDDTGPCAGGFVFTSLSGLFCALSSPCKAMGESSLGVWLGLDFPRSDRSRGTSQVSLNTSPVTLFSLDGGSSFFSWDLV